ncbi:MAG: hypothetical protein H7Z38_21570 [Rubrivivax sp.]|nr:hypothetical protein [Pyrinomonadaceae bacterium]
MPLGTVVFWRDRAEDRRHVKFRCRGCFEQTGQLKTTQPSHIIRYLHGYRRALALVGTAGATTAAAQIIWLRIWPFLKSRLHPHARSGYWDELCSDCAVLRGSLKKLTRDYVQDNWTVVCISEEDEDGEVPIFYPGCEHTRLTDWITARKMRGEFSDVCRDCSYSVSDFRKRLREIGGDKERLELLDVIQAMEEVWLEARRPTQDLKEQYRHVTQAKVAAKANLGDGAKGSESQLRSTLLRLGIKSVFPGAGTRGDWYASLRDTVLDAIEAGEPPAKVAAHLWMRRVRALEKAEFPNKTGR